MRPDVFDVDQFPDLKAFASTGAATRPLRVCIATEEIYGPVRNGGIASTYYYLARLLREEGHDVTVLLLKGNKSENGPIEDWIAFYARLGVKLVPMPMEDAQGFSFWQRRQYSAYAWLKNQSEPFDVVHASEWRGGLYYTLLAKQQGLAFDDTLFLIKASSPHIWNRHYLMDFMASMGMMGVMYSEQMSIELGDMVIGGSAHLLSFMDHVGYSLPEGRTYVQPNVLQLGIEGVTDQRGAVAIGDVIRSSELVFFGRLEARKGLEIFCDALDFIVARGVAPERVAFLGKEGGNLPSTPHIKNKAYIEMRARNWPFEIELHDDFQQTDALNFLMEKPRLAVMPSLVENSTMAVYETLIYKIPFLATAVGGTPELIAEADRDRVLCDANPRSLADSLERLLTEGGLVAECAFDNEENLSNWRAFHTHLAERKAAGTLGELNAPGRGGKPPSLSLCVQADDDADRLGAFLDAAAFAGGKDLLEIVVATAALSPEIKAAVAAERAVPVRLVDAREMSLGEAWNAAAAAAKGAALMFLRCDIHTPRRRFATLLRKAFAASGDVALASFWRHRAWQKGAEKTILPIGNDKAMAILDAETFAGRGVAILASCFKEIGGFDPIFGVAGIEQDLLHRAARKGQVNIVPEPLYLEIPSHTRKRLNEYNAQYMSISSIIAEEPYFLKRLHLSMGHLMRELPQGKKTALAGLSCDMSLSRLVNVSPLPEIGYERVPRMRLVFDEASGELDVLLEGGGKPRKLSARLGNKALPDMEFADGPDGSVMCRIRLREIGGAIGCDPVRLRLAVVGDKDAPSFLTAAWLMSRMRPAVVGDKDAPHRSVSIAATGPYRIELSTKGHYIETRGAARKPDASDSDDAAAQVQWMLDCGAEQTRRMWLGFDPARAVFRVTLPTAEGRKATQVVLSVNGKTVTGDMLPDQPAPTAEAALLDHLLRTGSNALLFSTDKGPKDLKRSVTVKVGSLSRLIQSRARIDMMGAAGADAVAESEAGA